MKATLLNNIISYSTFLRSVVVWQKYSVLVAMLVRGGRSMVVGHSMVKHVMCTSFVKVYASLGISDFLFLWR